MDYFLVLGVLLLIYMSTWFVLSVVKKRNDVADTAWGLGFMLLAWVSFYIGEAQGSLGLLVGTLVSIWGIRLALHIHKRNKGKTEDYRYAKWREEWGKWFYLRSYAQVYLLQGILLFLIVLPVLFINMSTSQNVGVLAFLGLAVWILGFIFESVGDAQLARFIKNPAHKGMLMRSGLWKYTRHPNYFGEVSQWWGIFLLALPSPVWFVLLIGPLTISFLILKVSGIPMLEKKYENNPEFQAYKRATSAFFPWKPRV